MAKEDVRLLGSWASPFGLRVGFALNIKSVDYEFLQETFGSKSQLLLQSNPVHKKIPVLIHANKPIPESLIILEYIDQVWPSPSILPSDPYDRAMARFWAAYADEKLFPFIRASISAKEEGKKGPVDELAEVMGLLEEAFGKLSRGKPFFGGDHVGFLDMAIGSYLGWLRVVERTCGVNLIGGAKTPGLAGWAEKFSADDAVKDLMLDTEKLLEVSKFIRAKMRGESPSPVL